VSTDDDLITNLIDAATEFVEAYTGLQLMKAAHTLYLDSFPASIALNIAPIQSLTSVKYYDDSNDLQTLASANYDSDIESEPARIMVSYGYTWPNTYDRYNAVQIAFATGYSDSDTEATQRAAVPESIRQAILLHIGHNYENRGDEGHRVYPKAIYDLLDKYRLFWL
jgi:uncharacterized phiE125 gp8 family phage protein